MNIQVIAFGKLKTAGLREAADHYTKMIRPWASLEEIEFKPIPVPEKSTSIRAKIQEKEGVTLMQQMGESSRYYLLDEKGKPLVSTQWAHLLKDAQERAYKQVHFCIGSSLGFSDTVRKGALGLISLGPQTLSHELARVVLYEQIYRALSILRGHPYHNEG